MSTADEMRRVRASLKEVAENLAIYREALKTAAPSIARQLTAQIAVLERSQETLGSQLGPRATVEPRRDRRLGHARDGAWR